MKNTTLWMVIGVISVIAGILALANPFGASLAVEQFIGWMFLFAGVMQILAAWQAKGFSAKIWTALAGLIGLFVGTSLLAHPLQGMVSLTLLIAILFLVTGVFKVIAAMSFRGTKMFMPTLVSGLISGLLAVLILSDFPESAQTILGVLLAIELIFNGAFLVSLSWAKKSAVAEDSPAAADD